MEKRKNFVKSALTGIVSGFINGFFGGGGGMIVVPMLINLLITALFVSYLFEPDILDIIV